ncbi:cob(I)yrinic acid a,c-diamide adenosyltransferase [Hydrogenophilus thermoluteolus]|jgi:cob(I)alamin adenosyltransferase|uniref:cob(I)yrinic acid a,c-diamide adenosyltransferase n=1 Tax=Hydrogenophilus thermoluteolus TaxID=297 RepID=UPI000EC0FB3C|nr:cob(I)yrinic acid a,c-diamide adenosyltransferase [Hydrogenophilus thermoluteolus]MBW7656127.1 cob(I)yrinic acid a,c-diamide adenosyltransferase [Hydrogenophilus thermoluteolus]HCO76715.1 cob(I)yrinic acid a,c-diamide adenosyltransferase [Rhodocyclaceae bacterium]
MADAPERALATPAPTQTDATEARHQARMARKKAVIDQKIAAAKTERGVVLVHTGPGKGKSTAAFGLLARALGHGLRAVVVQFVKGRSDTGEEAFFRRQANVTWVVSGEGFTWETQSRARDVAAAEAGWRAAETALADPTVGLVVLDELNIVLKYRYLPLERVLTALANRPAMQHVVITGRGAPPELLAAADTVTEMRLVKHAFQAGVAAMPGVEF